MESAGTPARAGGSNKSSVFDREKFEVRVVDEAPPAWFVRRIMPGSARAVHAARLGRLAEVLHRTPASIALGLGALTQPQLSQLMVWANNHDDDDLLYWLAHLVTDFSFDSRRGDVKFAEGNEPRGHFQDANCSAFYKALVKCFNMKSLSIAFVPTKSANTKLHLSAGGNPAMAAFIAANVPEEPVDPEETAVVLARSYTSRLPHPDPAKRKDPTGDFIEGYWSSQMGISNIENFLFHASRIDALKTLCFTGGAAACSSMSELFHNLKHFKRAILVCLRDNAISARDLNVIAHEITFLAAGSIIDVDEPELTVTYKDDPSVTKFSALPADQPPVAGQWRFFFECESGTQQRRVYDDATNSIVLGDFVPVTRYYSLEWDTKRGSGERYLARTE